MFAVDSIPRGPLAKLERTPEFLAAVSGALQDDAATGPQPSTWFCGEWIAAQASIGTDAPPPTHDGIIPQPSAGELAALSEFYTGATPAKAGIDIPEPAPSAIPPPRLTAREIVDTKNTQALQELSGLIPLIHHLPLARYLSARFNNNCSTTALNFMLGYAQNTTIDVTPWQLYKEKLSDVVARSEVRCLLPREPFMRAGTYDPAVYVEMHAAVPGAPAVAQEFAGILNRNTFDAEGLWQLLRAVATFTPAVHRVFAIGGDRLGSTKFGNHAFNGVVLENVVKIIDVRYGIILDFPCTTNEEPIPAAFAKYTAPYKIMFVYEACCR